MLKIIIARLLIAAVSAVFICLFKKYSKNGNGGEPQHVSMGILAFCGVSLLCTALAWVVTDSIPMPTEQIEITAMGERNDKAKSDEVVISGVYVGGKNVDLDVVSPGQWFFMQGNRYMWRNAADTRRPKNISEHITIEIPIGVSRRIEFSTNPWRGFVKLSSYGEDNIYDCYSSEGGKIAAVIRDTPVSVIRKQTGQRLIYYAVIYIAALCVCMQIARMKHRSYEMNLYNVVTKPPVPSSLYYMLAVFAFLAVRYVSFCIFPNTARYINTYYVLGYEMGFIKRGLLGQILLSISPYIYERDLLVLKQVVFLLFYLLVSILIVRCLSDLKDRITFWILLILPLCLPSAVIYISDDARQDIYLMLLLIVSALLIGMGKFVWFVPVCAITAMLLQETAIVYVVPQMIMLLCYRAYKDRKPESFLSLMAAAAFSVWLAIYFMFFVLRVPAGSLPDYGQYIASHLSSSKTEVSALVSPLADGLGAFYDSFIRNYKNAEPEFYLFILLALPLFWMVTVLYGETVKRVIRRDNLKNSSLFYAILCCMGLSCAAPLVAAFISLDYPRHVAFSINSVFVMLFFLIKSEGVQLDIKRMKAAGQKALTPVIVAVMIFYMEYGSFASTYYATPFVRKLAGVVGNLF